MAAQEHHRKRAAHPAQLGDGAAATMDVAVDLIDGFREEREQLAAVLKGGIGEVGRGRSVSDRPPQARDCHLRRDLAALVSTHTIRDGKHPKLRLAEEGVFVILADAAYIAKPRRQES
jgi:transposase